MLFDNARGLRGRVGDSFFGEVARTIIRDWLEDATICVLLGLRHIRSHIVLRGGRGVVASNHVVCLVTTRHVVY